MATEHLPVLAPRVIEALADWIAEYLAEPAGQPQRAKDAGFGLHDLNDACTMPSRAITVSAVIDHAN